MEQSTTKIEDKINAIQLDVREIATKLDAMQGYDDRLRNAELWIARQQGYRSSIQYLINLAIGILGILIGLKLF